MENYENNEIMVNEETNNEVVESKKGINAIGVIGIAAVVGTAIAVGIKVGKKIKKKLAAKKEAQAKETVEVEAVDVAEEN